MSSNRRNALWLEPVLDPCDPNAGSALTGAAFDRHARRLYAPLLRLATQRCGYSAAPDVVQNALIAAWQHRARFDTLTGFPGFARFLTAYLRYACRDYHAETARREIPTDPEVLFRALDADTLPDLTDAYYALCKERLLDLLVTTRLSGAQETCVRQWLDGQTQQQIADFLGISQPVVFVHLKRAAQALRQNRQADVAMDVLEVFLEEGEEKPYLKPGWVWDRDGLGGEVQARRSEAAQERYERRREREGFRP